VARRRAQWKKYQGRLDPKRLVFIDETWAKTNMARRHGRCMRGTRLVAKVPHDRWRALTSSPPCAAIGSTLLASSMDRSTAKASAPASSRCSSQRCNPAMSSSWTISAATSGNRSAAPSAPPAPSSSSCRPTRPTSIPRAGLRQAQDTTAQGCRANHRSHVEVNRPSPRCLHSGRMRQLPQERWICLKLR
jgi:hypothetical protein